MRKYVNNDVSEDQRKITPISVSISARSRPDIQASKLKDCTPKIQENWD